MNNDIFYANQAKQIARYQTFAKQHEHDGKLGLAKIYRDAANDVAAEKPLTYGQKIAARNSIPR